MTTDKQRRGSKLLPVKAPSGWRSVRRSGTWVVDSLVPTALLILAAATVALTGFAIAVLAGLL